MRTFVLPILPPALVRALALSAPLAFACTTTSIYQSPNSLQMTPPPSASIPTREPQGAADLERKLEENLAAKPSSGQGLTWWTRYTEARAWMAENSPRACGRFIEAADYPGFPLARLAYLRALLLCSPERIAKARVGETSGRWIDDAAVEGIPWLHEIALRAALAQAVATKDRAREMKLSIEVAKDERIIGRKVDLLHRAVALAHDLGNTEIEEDSQHRLEKIAPRFLRTPNERDLPAIALDLRRAREFGASREKYRAIVAGDYSDDEKFRALDGLRTVDKLERKMGDWAEGSKTRARFALTKLRAARSKADKQKWLDQYYTAQLDFARAVWTNGSPEGAVAALDELARLTRRRRPIDEAYWVRARIEDEAGRHRQAIAFLQKAQTGPTRGGPALSAKIKWARAWDLAKLKDFKTAALEAEALSTIESAPGAAARDLFWSAKWRARAGSTDAAKITYTKLLEDDPLGYYGLLARRELGQPLPPIIVRRTDGTEHANDHTNDHTNDQTRAPATALFVSPTQQNEFDWLTSCGEGEIAKRMLDAVAGDRIHLGDVFAHRALERAYARAGAYGAMFEKLTTLTPAERAALLAQEPELVFPRPFSAISEAAAKKAPVSIEFVYSIMRQESSFNPEARSPADAFGLMQLLPLIAEKSAVRDEAGYRMPEDLFRPEVNLPIGAQYLRELLNRWGGQMPLAAASYNASERVVQSWLRTRFHGDALEFIEDIPYDETRGYVKLVARNFVFYSRLAQPSHPMQFPEAAINIDPTRGSGGTAFEQ